ncbi:hypothetical protein N0O92_04990 [Alkalihalobacillus sp. MEB130]|uniref:hypothetical protein n=1 Tax=Alkalihalobacillus sp. MEB130 TaxID=2976704 RepID=UPI0028DFE205|nr:hypothetical protein [Alkalihalobacillus sp. MEB130]MDT8859581.1 hypothetical protein [Alkalihalobacillus sp. MEB130]
MTYQRDRMKRLLGHDRFLTEAFEEALQFTRDEDQALHLLFRSYITGDPIFTNAYNLLTD